VRDEDGNSQGWVVGMLPGEVLPRVCIARAAANESGWCLLNIVLCLNLHIPPTQQVAAYW